ncbi:MAG TPA: histidine kinase dimerization/phosphoacceptor domain -containing protein [Stellaceae bacterium]|nr:histidine kinase dimerization/phosphoacceptor domain -containing protein [Stellaceae bacterium]
MPLRNAENRRKLETAIVDTVREPLVVLDDKLNVLIASRSFYSTFKVSQEDTEGRPLHELGNGQWNIPALRKLLDNVIPQHANIEEHEVEHEFPSIGRRIMRLNARKVFYEGNNSTSLLLAIEDVTDRRGLERDKDALMKQKDLLLQEMHHRVNNSLQIIASILLLKAQTVQSEETRQHLRDAHERVVAVATVQQQLQPATFGAPIGAKTYLTRLCESLAASMIQKDQPIALTTEIDDGTMTSEQAVSIGLITTELVINALKHAFPNGAKGTIVVRYEVSEEAWRLSVADDGIGMSGSLAEGPVKSGLGTSIVDALTRQLRGRVITAPGSPGTTVSVTGPPAA